MVEDSAEDQEMTVKLIDFGFGSRILEGVKLRAKVGTFVYLGVPSNERPPPTQMAFREPTYIPPEIRV